MVVSTFKSSNVICPKEKFEAKKLNERIVNLTFIVINFFKKGYVK